jgi:putative transposase
VAIAFKTSTLLSFHRALVQRKYRLLFSPKQRTKPGPKGPAADLIRAVVEMKKQSDLGMPSDCRSDQLGFRNFYK